MYSPHTRKIAVMNLADSTYRKLPKSMKKLKNQPSELRTQSHSLSLMVNDRVLNEVKCENLRFGVVDNDDMNSPAERRNSNLHTLMKNNVGSAVGAPSEIDLSYALGVHHWEMLMFLETPEAFYYEKYRDPKSSPDYVKMTWQIKGINCGVVGYSTDEDGPDIYQQTSRELEEDMGVIKSSVEKMLQHKSNDTYAMPTHPGHHAGPNHIGGYCYINNAAVAAHHLMKQGKSVGIIDVDYHGGNGTYDFLPIMKELHFVSIHAQNDYPETEMFKHGRGLPFGTTWEQYSTVLKEVLNTMANLDIIIISLGFDTLNTDPLTHDIDGGGFELTPEDFFSMGKMIGETNQQIMFIQEGGYDIKNIPEVCRQLLSGFQSVRKFHQSRFCSPASLRYTKDIKLNKHKNYSHFG